MLTATPPRFFDLLLLAQQTGMWSQPETAAPLKHAPRVTAQEKVSFLRHAEREVLPPSSATFPVFVFSVHGAAALERTDGKLTGPGGVYG